MKIVFSAALAAMLMTAPAFADLKTAQDALKTGNFPLALNEAQKIKRSHPVDAALITARSLIELGRPQDAERVIRPLVDQVPKFFSARMLLGAALMAQDKTLEAEIQYRRALDVAQQPREENMARSVLRNIQSRRSFTLNGMFSLAPSTNVGNNTNNETVTLTYGEAEITSSKANSGIGVLGSLTIDRNFYRKDGYKVSVGVGAFEKRYKDTAYNLGARSFNIRLKDTRNVRSKVDLFATYSSIDFGNETYSDTISVGGSTQYCLTRDCRALRTNFKLDKMTMADATHPDSYGVRAGMSLDLLKGKSFSLAMNSTLEKRRSDNVNLAYKGASAGLRGVYIPNGTSLILTGGIKRSLKKWDDIAPLFTTKRFDQSWEVNLSARNPKLSYLGYTPFIDYSFTQKSSTIEFYDMQSHDVMIGITNAF